MLAWGHAAEVDLLAGEIPLLAWDATFIGKWWASPWGTLYLTDQRLVWIRWRSSLPLGLKTLEISLDSVTGVEVRRRWSHLFHRAVLVQRRGEAPCEFLPARFGPGARSIVTEITSILRERGLLRD